MESTPITRVNKKRILVDFDGVLHSYTSGWQGAEIVKDEPTFGAIAWLKKMINDDRFEVVIFSTRNATTPGEWAIRLWLEKHGITPAELASLKFTATKLPAIVLLDDRCIQFCGVFPTAQEFLEFKPWNKANTDALTMLNNLLLKIEELSDYLLKEWKDHIQSNSVIDATILILKEIEERNKLKTEFDKDIAY